MNTVSEYCAGCAECVDFSSSGSGSCDFLERNGFVRPCPAGPKGCALKSKRARKEKDMSKMRTWDAERAKALLAEGKTVKEVAEAVGATVNSITAWKNKECAVKSAGEEAGEPAQAVPEGVKGKAGTGKRRERATMSAAALGELLATAAREFDDPQVLLPHGGPVRGCRITLNYDGDGKTRKVDIWLNEDGEG